MFDVLLRSASRFGGPPPLAPTGLVVGHFPALFLLAGLALGPATASSRPAGWPPIAAGDVVRDSAVVLATRMMALDLLADADSTFPLFGPVREAEWSPD